MVQQQNEVFTLSIDQLLASTPCTPNINATRLPPTYVQCPLDPSHRMPAHRLQWHLINRCKVFQQYSQLGMLWHCKNQWTHVFTSEWELRKHEDGMCQAKGLPEQEVVEGA